MVSEWTIKSSHMFILTNRKINAQTFASGEEIDGILEHRVAEGYQVLGLHAINMVYDLTMSTIPSPQ